MGVIVGILVSLILLAIVGIKYQQRESFPFSLKSYKCHRIMGIGLLLHDLLNPYLHFEKHKMKIYQLYGRHTFQDRYRLFVAERICTVFLILFITTLLSMVLSVNDRGSIETITRPEFSQGNQIRQYGYNIKGDMTQYEGHITLTIPSVYPNKEESYHYLEAMISEIETQLSNNELGLYETYSDLNCPTQYNKIHINWSSSDSQYLIANGRVRSERISQPTKVTLTAIYGFNHLKLYRKYHLVLHPIPMGVDVNHLEEVLIEQVIDLTSKSDYVVLPDEIDGYKISWMPSQSWLNRTRLFILGIFIAILFYYLKAKALDESITKRTEEIQLRLPNLVNKIALLIQAGMTFNSAWNKVVADYRKIKDTSGIKYELYEEMIITLNDIAKGTPELVAYELFARKTGCKEVYRFITIVTQNIKKGNLMLSTSLLELSYDIWQQREQRAKIKGEKASTKMVLPTVMILLIVVVIIITAAFLKIQM